MQTKSTGNIDHLVCGRQCQPPARRRFQPTVTARFSILLLLAIAIPYGVAQERPLFSSVSELIVLHVTVKDHRGAYVTNLPETAFRVYEDGVPQAIRVFTNQDAPVTVGLVIDTSGSMLPKLKLVVAAAAAFADASNAADDIFGLTFNEQTQNILPSDAPFTSDVAVLHRAFTNNARARGRTALYDAISAGLQYVTRGEHERKVLVVVSDGGDNASRTSFQRVLTETQASNAVIFAVSLFDPEDRDANPKALKQIAEASGGEAFAPGDIAGTRDVMLHIAREIRNAYTIGYASTNPVPDGRLRRIRATVDAPASRGVSVRTRAGYIP